MQSAAATGKGRQHRRAHKDHGKAQPRVVISPNKGSCVISFVLLIYTAALPKGSSRKPGLELAGLFYCTTKLKLVVAVNPVLVAVTVTAKLPAGVPGTGAGAGGATPQPAIASRSTRPSMISMGKRFTPFLRCPPKPASIMPNTGKANMA